MRLRSINTAIIIGILVALVISFSTASWYTVSVTRKALYAEFERQRTDLAASIAEAMTDPILTYSPNDGSRALELVKQDSALAAIHIYDSLNELDFISIDVPDRRIGTLFETTVPIVRAGETFGTVRLVYNDHRIVQELTDTTTQFLTVLGLALLAIVAIVFPLLYVKLFRPLERLSAQAENFRHNDLETPISWTGEDELSRVGQSFEKARVSMLELVNELKRVSITDRLTGLRNRHRLDEHLADELSRATRYGHRLGVVLLDIDHFKSVNDTHGHQVGDEVLKTFARLLTEHTRESDIVGRWGGEEFMIICPECDRESLMGVVEKLRHAIEVAPFPVVGTKTASFGATIFANNESAKDMIARADEALYRAKEKGRNRVEFMEPRIAIPA